MLIPSRWSLFIMFVYLYFFFFFFFFTDTATTEIYTLSLHDALPIYMPFRGFKLGLAFPLIGVSFLRVFDWVDDDVDVVHRSEEHTSEFQSHSDLVCRLLLEKKKKKKKK